MSIPSMPIALMYRVYRKVLPQVHHELKYWKEKAKDIPNDELRKQALASIEDKTFHCEGGGILSLIANESCPKAIKFIVAYQTISDYLDNLCDRSTSLDPADFAAIHESMEDALSDSGELRNYYREREDCNDGGYLEELVTVCRETIAGLPSYPLIKGQLNELCRYYCDLQIHKHVEQGKRVERLKEWFDGHRDKMPEMQWYEFSACTGSTLGIFCLVSYAMRDDFRPEFADSIRNGYFPYIQGLHILLDYFIDQDEDLKEGDLNFCFYYESEEALFSRLLHFIENADYHTSNLPHRKFHQLINRGLLGVYLSDEKVRSQHNVKKLAKSMIKSGGHVSYFFYVNGLLYRSIQKWVPASLVRSFVK
ncbi:tetraprenyl-beta-curcumene synthase family protein [Mesobacillus zeae]|uniref:Tetraprenyl-beta-curcumene synthase family protein n=1 Tax=Mesobacillus zeae TaxID=1917180 RepID=A0A398AZF7_9BACI|nr:tetraprenyl-beta-curcumene synthase family protein [Mesobacillus zeae]RID83049.1 tetraprenyl-beta-curcumene synthase family protein [Mesobacillus zeae]